MSDNPARTAEPFQLDDAARDAIAQLVARAQAAHIDVAAVLAKADTPQGERQHRARMTALSTPLPCGYLATYSIETGHPAGICRHLSLSSSRPGFVPAPGLVEVLMHAFGFSGSPQDCAGWLEPLQNGNYAINLVQPVPS